MGWLGPVARVGCSIPHANAGLEEWSPLYAKARRTEPGLQTLWQTLWQALWHFGSRRCGRAKPGSRRNALASARASVYPEPMARYARSNDWGFPRWRGYGSESGATRVRLCDRDGCTLPGTCPAPKSPNSPERWMFCPDHAGEYNRGWNYFEGLSEEEAAARAADEGRDASGWQSASHYRWAGPGDGSRSRDEMRALEVLQLDSDADFASIKAAWRRLAKASHPDARPGDSAAAEQFRAVQAAWDVLRQAEERRPT